MSEAFAKMLGGEKVEAYSAGIDPTGSINPQSITAMKELGYDLSEHTSKPIKDVEHYAPFDVVVVTMDCGDACARIPTEKYMEWNIPDPKDMAQDQLDKVRDEIKEKVSELLSSI